MATSKFTLNVTECTLGSTEIKVNITRDKDTYTHKIKVYCGDLNTEVATSVATSYSFTPSIDWCKYITKATSATATIKVKTYKSDGTKVGELSKTIKFKIPKSVVPTVGISITPNNQKNGYNVENKTTFTVKPKNASGAYGSTIKSYSISGGGLSSTSSSGATTKTLKAGDYTFRVKITDSRGRTAEATKQVTVYGYYGAIVSGKVYRCMEDGTGADMGLHASVEFTWDISPLSETSTKKYSIQYKLISATSFTDVVTDKSLPSRKGSMKYIFTNEFDITKTYQIQVIVDDGTRETAMIQTLSTVSALLNIEKDGVGIGKIHEKGSLDVGGEIYIDGAYRVAKVGGTGNMDLGNAEHITSICSSSDPMWWNGGETHKFFTDVNCTVKVNSSQTRISMKFENGVLIETYRTSGSYDFEDTWGSLFTNGSAISLGNFMQAFMNTPSISLSAYTSTGGVIAVQTNPPTTTSAGSILLCRPDYVTSKSTIYYSMTAVGRWK